MVHLTKNFHKFLKFKKDGKSFEKEKFSNFKKDKKDFKKKDSKDSLHLKQSRAMSAKGIGM